MGSIGTGLEGLVFSPALWIVPSNSGTTQKEMTNLRESYERPSLYGVLATPLLVGAYSLCRNVEIPISTCSIAGLRKEVLEMVGFAQSILLKGITVKSRNLLWRSRGGVENGADNRDFQLISWGTDRDLHLHRIDPRHLRAVGHEKGKEVRKRLNLTRLGAVYKTFRDEKPKSSDDGLDIAALRNFRPQGLGALVTAAGMSKTPIPLTPVGTEVGFMTSSLNTYGRRHPKKLTNPMKWIEGVKIGNRGVDAFDSLHRKSSAMVVDDAPENLSDEMTLVAKKYKKVVFEDADVHGRTATVTLTGPWGQNEKPVFLRITFEFPPTYPREATPELTFERDNVYHFRRRHAKAKRRDLFYHRTLQRQAAWMFRSCNHVFVRRERPGRKHDSLPSQWRSIHIACRRKL